VQGKSGPLPAWYAEMVADNSGGEGMFIPFTFMNGQTYNVSVAFTSSGANGNIYFAAANGLYQHQNPQNSGCQAATQTNSNNQVISWVSGGNNTLIPLPAFTPSGGSNGGYTQLWMYTAYTGSGGTFSAQIYQIQICPVCNVSAPTGLQEINDQGTLNWTAVTGASSYIISITDTHNGTPNYSSLTSGGNYLNFCPLGVGDNVSFTVQPVCANGAAGPTSSVGSYVYSPAALAIPNDITYTPLNTLSWSAVPGAISYLVVLKDISDNNAETPYVTNTNTVSGSNAELETGQTYEVQVTAQACAESAASAWSNSFTVVQPCPVPYVSNVEALGGGKAYVSCNAVSGAASYNIKFVDGSSTTLFSNYASANGTFTGIPAGTYTVSVQANCTTGYSSAWGSYYANVAISSTASQAISRPGTFGINGTNSPDSLNGFQIYPVPSSTQVNILYNTMQNGKADIMIVNELGTTVVHKAISAIAGPNTYQISVSGLANGIYFVKLTDGRNMYVQKLLVQK